MLLLLVATLVRLSHAEGRRFSGASCFMLALVCLPAMRLYAVSEGGAMPMIFFVTLGLVEWTLAQLTADPARLGLGMTLLFVAAMAKLEGIVILVAALFMAAAVGLGPAGGSAVLRPVARAGFLCAGRAPVSLLATTNPCAALRIGLGHGCFAPSRPGYCRHSGVRSGTGWC